MFVTTMGTVLFLKNGSSPSAPSSNSWLPRVIASKFSIAFIWAQENKVEANSCLPSTPYATWTLCTRAFPGRSHQRWSKGRRRFPEFCSLFEKHLLDHLVVILHFVDSGDNASKASKAETSGLVLGGAGGGVLVRLLHPRVDVVHVQQAQLPGPDHHGQGQD